MRRLRLLAAALAGSLLAACALIAGLPDYEEKKAGNAEGGPDSPSPVPPPPPSEAGDDGPGGPDAMLAFACDASPMTAPFGYWPLDEGSGLVAFDCTAQGNHGDINGASWTPPPRVGAHALAFDGDSSVELRNPPQFAITGAISVTAWTFVTDVSTAGRIVSKGGGPNDRGWEINVESTGTIGFMISPDAGAEIRAEATTFQTGKWVHVAGVFDPGIAVRFYLDGTLAQEVTTNIPATQNNTAHTVAFGRRPENICCGLKGYIDDVRIFKRALSSAEVAILAR
jgi:hypothetical protein